jgi:lipoprotein-anchoring transpeptidase ErfK/SrfK
VTGELTAGTTTGFRDGKRVLVLRGDRVEVTGVLTPFVPGQKAQIRVKLGRKVLVRRQVAITPAAGGTGAYAARIRMPRTGTMTIQVSHAATPELAATRAGNVRLLVVRPRLSFGARGALLDLFQRRLRALRYPVARTGVYDARTGRAVMAWRKVNGRARLETADEGVIRSVLQRRGAWKVRHPGAGRHVEADISLQALALVDGRRVVRVYPTSSGAPATPTVLGRYRFYLKTPGTNAKGMVDSSYFIRGYAIHGYASVPPYNASHGCLRVPIPDARTIFDWIRIGDRIFVEA